MAGHPKKVKPFDVMPAALTLRMMAICSEPGCPVVVDRGPCPQHARKRDQRRGSAYSRGYDTRWKRHVARFIAALVEAGVPPVCGAVLPSTPPTNDSLCAAEGLSVMEHLDCDHIEPHAGQDDPKFWDMGNLQLLCHGRCHPRKTATKDGGFGRPVDQ